MPKLILGHKDGMSQWFEESLPKGWDKKPDTTDDDLEAEAEAEAEALQSVDEMELPQLHQIAKDMGQKMAVNIGLEKAREKVKAMLEAE